MFQPLVHSHKVRKRRKISSPTLQKKFRKKLNRPHLPQFTLADVGQAQGSRHRHPNLLKEKLHQSGVNIRGPLPPKDLTKNQRNAHPPRTCFLPTTTKVSWKKILKILTVKVQHILKGLLGALKLGDHPGGTLQTSQGTTPSPPRETPTAASISNTSIGAIGW